MKPYRGIHNGGWKYGYHSYDFMRNEDVIVNSQGSWPVIPETIGQQVGICDKNGKEGFNGDILQLPNRTYRIEWDNSNAKYILHPTEYNNAELININYIREGDICGTIHDAEAEV